jgi:polysaccharide biosynthesis/export protein
MRSLILVFWCVLTLTACTGSRPPLPSNDEGPYRLDSGDQVRILIYNEQTLSTVYAVGDNGTISFPMIGEVKARGLSVEELRKAVYAALSNGVFVNPGVSVEVSQYRPFYVVGEVSKPGQYPYVAGLNVLTAVALAGGFTVRADENHMTVVRTLEGHAKEWGVKRLTALQPGDVVVVREQFF